MDQYHTPTNTNMMIESGRVVAVESDCLWVETIRKSTCGSCSVQKGCGHGLLSKIQVPMTHQVRVLLNGQSSASYQVGDEVDISIPDDVLVKGALIVYLLPLAMMLLFGVSLNHLFATDLAAVIGSVFGLAIGFAAIRWHAYSTRNRKDYQPALVGLHVQSHSDVQVVNPI